MADVSDVLGCFTHHVYLGFSTYDLPVVSRLQSQLESKRINCFPRCDAAERTASIQSNITHGIACSRKILLYITEHYNNESWSKMESQKATEKASRFSRDSVIIVKENSLQSLSSDFNACPCFFADEMSIEEPQFIQRLVEEILKGIAYLTKFFPSLHLLPVNKNSTFDCRFLADLMYVWPLLSPLSRRSPGAVHCIIA